MGLGAALLFVAGLLMVTGNKLPKPSAASGNMLAGSPQHVSLGNASSLQTIRLGAGSSMSLLAEYSQENGRLEPRGLYATTVGLIVGHIWEPLTGQLTQHGQQLQFTAVVRHKWQLLGTEVYQQAEEFTGLMPTPAH